jgi:hypothetical protein
MTVAKALDSYGAKIAGGIIQTIRQGYATGETTQSITKNIQDLVEQKITRAQAISVARTVVNHVSNSAKESFYKENDDLITGYQVVATLDDRTTLTCFLDTTQVINLGELENVFRCQYSGEIITITTASGKQLSGTPNHPILTPEGFLPLGELNPREHVVYTATDEAVKVFADQDISMHANIGQLFNTVNEPSRFDIFRKCPTQTDFYGDGEFFKGEIDIVSIKGELRSDFHARLHKRIIDECLSFVHRRVYLPTVSFFNKHFITRLPILQPSGFNSIFKQNTVQSTFRQPQFNYNFTRSCSVPVHFQGSDSARVALASLDILHNSSSFEQIGDCCNGSAILSSESTSTGTSLVFEDNIISVKREFKNCHVYSLSSSIGLYIASGVIVKNCAALDGQVFDKDEFEYPPYHWNCRSTYIGVIDPKFGIFNPGAARPSKGSDGAEEVAAGTTYNSWLRKQSDEFQNDVLGVKRAELFRSGESVQSFVDHNYQPYTLDELKAKDSQHN